MKSDTEGNIEDFCSQFLTHQFQTSIKPMKDLCNDCDIHFDLTTITGYRDYGFILRKYSQTVQCIKC